MSVPSKLLVALLIGGVSCKNADSAGGAEQARKAVDDFYAWYVPMQHGTNNAAMRAVHDRPTLFSANLVTALRADSTASARSPGEVVGLDGDPFLNAQDPCDHYTSRGVAEVGSRYFVQVLGSGGCATHADADVTVEVTPANGHFVFTNFIYSSRDRDDLIGLLAYLDSSRRRKSK
jgi:hypothetical protein